MPDRIAPAEAPSAGRARPRVLTVASGKGGVGKSSIAVNLGITLARRGRRVCILDGDTGLANVNILLGLRPARGLAEVLAGECGIEEVLLEGPHGLRIIPGASGLREYAELSPAQQRRLVDELARIEPDFDDLLLDTAAGIGATTLDFLAAGHQVLLVLTPEPTSLTDAFSLLKLALRQQALEVRVIVNMVADVAEARSVFQRFANAAEKYLHTRVEFFGFIQRDESLRSAVTLQHPVALFAEDDPSARPFQRLADALEEDVPAPDAMPLSRFWGAHLAPEAEPPPASSAPGAEPESGAAADPAPEGAPAAAADPAISVVVDAEPSDVPDAPNAPNAPNALDALHQAFERSLREASPESLGAALDELQARYRALAAAPDRVERQSRVDTPDPRSARVESAPAATPPPDFGWRAAAAESAPVTGSGRLPGYDHERFGCQDALAERLRQRTDADLDLAAFLRRLSD
ncbi:MinD/ParA family protein [Thioalkalivibrio sp. ALJ16]|uniref:MinD/ParA family protein n=1 Tax=Thioalkalivibrio sp. ALJ16 TaxID=1158762 RepID=UPI0004765682|nr:MinD/ParA family protein [Thioalkalivibrio sp. ALJ16]